MRDVQRNNTTQISHNVLIPRPHISALVDIGSRQYRKFGVEQCHVTGSGSAYIASSWLPCLGTQATVVHWSYKCIGVTLSNLACSFIIIGPNKARVLLVLRIPECCADILTIRTGY